MKGKNNFIIILIVLIPLISLYFKKRDTNHDLPFVFERKLSPNTFLKQESCVPFEEDLDQSLLLKNDSTLILSSQKGNIMSLIYWNFKNGQLDTLQRKVNSHFLINSIEKDYCFYVDRFKIKSINLHDSSTDTLALNHISIYSVFECPDQSLLALGYQEDTYSTTFYKIIQGQAIPLKKIKKEETNDKSHIMTNFLSYNGAFCKANNYIIYRCDLQSLIFLFDLKGNYITTIKTKENIPEPTITVFNDIYVYTRERTFNSNVGAFTHKGYLNVISYRSNNSYQVVVDRYSISNGEYVNSYTLDDLQCSNRKIRQVFQTKDKVVFLGEEKVYFYKFIEQDN